MLEGGQAAAAGAVTKWQRQEVTFPIFQASCARSARGVLPVQSAARLPACLPACLPPELPPFVTACLRDCLPV